MDTRLISKKRYDERSVYMKHHRLIAFGLILTLALGLASVGYAATGNYDFQMKTSIDGGFDISSKVTKKDACGYFVLTVTGANLQSGQSVNMYVRDKNGYRVTESFYAKSSNTPVKGAKRDYFNKPAYGSSNPYRLRGLLNKNRSDGNYTTVKGRWTP